MNRIDPLEKDGFPDGLDEALAQAFPPPQAPRGLRAGLALAILREGAADLAERRRALEAERAADLARLRFGHLRMSRQTLALIVLVAFTAGSATAAFLPGIARLLAGDLAYVVPLLGLATGLAAAAAVLFGPVLRRAERIL